VDDWVETLMDADFYDEVYFDGAGKSNYSHYTFESSPFVAHAETIARVMEHHGLSGPVLDIGCSKGYLVSVLRQRGFDAYGVDWSEYAIASASPEVAQYLRRASATDLPFTDGEFSLAVSFDLLEHLDEPCARRAMVESARVSCYQLHQANTGRLEEWHFDGDSSHCLKYSLDQWQAMAADLGLTRMVICEPDRRLPFLDEAVH
jgi:SAM-dependent methyltransferase